MDMLSKVIGPKAAQLLRERFGGTDLYVPYAEQMENHPIANAIGLDAAYKLARWAGGSRLYISMLVLTTCIRSQNILRLTSEGLSAAEIAKKLRISDRTVRRYLEKHKRGGG